MDREYMVREQRYNKFIEHRWWTDIERRTVATWLNNFEEERRKIGTFILDNIIFYSKEQLDSYTLNIVNQIKGELFEIREINEFNRYRTDEFYFKEWEEYKSEFKIIPAAKQEDVGSSAYQVVRRYRTLLGDQQYVSNINSIEQCINSGIKELVFVDDFSGSGNQMKEFLEAEIEINGIKMKIGDISLSYPEVHINVAVYVIHKKAIELLSKIFPLLKIRYVDLIDEKIDFLNEMSVFYERLDVTERREIIEYIIQNKRKIMMDNQKYNDIERFQLNIPIVFEHGCPNNALLLLFAETDNWHQFFKLGEEK